MKISENQYRALKTLSQPYLFNPHHPIDSFDGRTIHSLEKRNLVEFYSTSSFLHGAVRLTEEGKAYMEKNLTMAV